MKIIEFLFGWTGYDPLSMFFTSVNTLLNLSFMLLVQYLPLRRFLRVRPRTAVLVNTGLVALRFVVYFAFPSVMTDAFGNLAHIYLYLLLIVPASFALLKGCVLQNLFVIPFALCSGTVVLGFGNWVEIWFADAVLPGTSAVMAILARLVLVPIFLPLIIRALNKLFTLWDGSTAKPFWRVLWIVPTILFCITMWSGNAARLTPENNLGFLVIRVCMLAALFTCISLMVGIIQKEEEAALAEERARELARESENLERVTIETVQEWDAASEKRMGARAVVEQVQQAARAGDHTKISDLLQEHIGEMDAVVPAGHLCDNAAVDSLVKYYARLAKDKGIQMEIHLQVPRTLGALQSYDLTRVVGNMLENAIEACGRMEYGHKQIKLFAKVMGARLVLGMDNSYDGTPARKSPEGGYLSSKREGRKGTGLTSIEGIAKKYNGSAKFKGVNTVFQTSVSLSMRE